MRATESDIVAIVHRVNGEVIDLSAYVHQYSDQHPIEGVPSFSLGLRHEIDGRPVFEVVDNGDILEVGLISSDGDTGKHGVGAYHTVMIGFVKTVGLRQDVDRGTLKLFAMISGPALGGVLANDSINYYTALGTLQGLFRTLAQVGVDEIGMTRLDKALAAFVERVAFNVLRIERPFGGLRDLLGFALRSLPGEGLFDKAWGNYEGSLWGFLQTYSEPPLHELYHRVLPASELESMPGEVHVPSKRFGTGPNQDQAVAALVMRPAPFPHMTAGGSGDTSAWHALPLHDLRDPRWSLQRADDSMTDKGDTEVVNFVHVYPKSLPSLLDETLNIHWVPPYINDEKWRVFGYKPLNFATELFGDAAHEDIQQFFIELNARLAGQHNRMDEYFQGKIGIRLAPHIRPGHRVALNLLQGDDTTEHHYYVSSVSHMFSVSGARKTTLELVRGLHRDLYDDPSWFAEGWQRFEPIKDQFLPLTDIREEDEPHD